MCEGSCERVWKGGGGVVREGVLNGCVCGDVAEDVRETRVRGGV